MNAPTVPIDFLEEIRDFATDLAKRAGELALSRWQNLFLCDFDGPRRARQVLVTITGAA